ncbi:MAG: hypothetical protein JWN38_984 [Candidatus Saccharibacteria bacterium]|nr:hypothetical protein [Candidatus Saccharibacteria bacterium]
MSSKESRHAGNWGETMSWEFRASAELPPTELCTGAFCVAITGDEKIVLMEAKRGWGLLGGHKEDDDATLAATAIREAQEEGGFTPDDLNLFGHLRITSTEPAPRPGGVGSYPFPESYLVYYWAITSQPLAEPTGEEVLSSRAFSLEELRAQNPPIRDLPIIEAGLQAYRAAQ